MKSRRLAFAFLYLSVCLPISQATANNTPVIDASDPSRLPVLIGGDFALSPSNPLSPPSVPSPTSAPVSNPPLAAAPSPVALPTTGGRGSYSDHHGSGWHHGFISRPGDGGDRADSTAQHRHGPSHSNSRWERDGNRSSSTLEAPLINIQFLTSDPSVRISQGAGSNSANAPSFSVAWTQPSSLRISLNPTETGSRTLDLVFTVNSAATAVAAIPEPQTWVMLLAGLGLAGAAGCSKRVRRDRHHLDTGVRQLLGHCA